MVERGLGSLINHIALAGGDILLRRAFENSTALTPANDNACGIRLPLAA